MVLAQNHHLTVDLLLVMGEIGQALSKTATVNGRFFGRISAASAKPFLCCSGTTRRQSVPESWAGSVHYISAVAFVRV